MGWVRSTAVPPLVSTLPFSCNVAFSDTVKFILTSVGSVNLPLAVGMLITVMGVGVATTGFSNPALLAGSNERVSKSHSADFPSAKVSSILWVISFLPNGFPLATTVTGVVKSNTVALVMGCPP